jgi:hypothetical protein
MAITLPQTRVERDCRRPASTKPELGRNFYVRALLPLHYELLVHVEELARHPDALRVKWKA